MYIGSVSGYFLPTIPIKPQNIPTHFPCTFERKIHFRILYVMIDNTIIIYHNPRCSKSREALAYLKNKEVIFTIREYLKEPLTKEELAVLFAKLGSDIQHVLRKNEDVYKKKYKGKELAGKKVIDAIFADQILMERPIVEVNDKAIVARPTEKIDEIL